MRQGPRPDSESLEQLETVVQDRIDCDDRVRRHSSLGARPPPAIIENLYLEG